MAELSPRSRLPRRFEPAEQRWWCRRGTRQKLHHRNRQARNRWRILPNLVVGTHTHIPTNDARILKGGTGYQTDAGMCGDYNSVIGMNAENSLNRFLKKNSVKHFPAIGDATLSGVIVECNINTGLATNIESYIFGAQLKNTH